MGVYTRQYPGQEKAILLPWLVEELAHRHHTTNRDEFRHLRSFGALDFYDRCFGVRHTYSIEDAADSIEEFCNNHNPLTA